MHRSNANLNNISIQNDKIILINTFKYALNAMPGTLNCFDCGLVKLECWFCTANTEQSNVIDLVICDVLHHDTASNIFCLTTYAGCGKIFNTNSNHAQFKFA